MQSHGNVHVFGELDGAPVFEIMLSNAQGAEARVITWGGVLRDLVVPHRGGRQRVVLGLNTLDDYMAHSPHMGATAGRFANRIAHGRFVLDGHHYVLPCNQAGKHSLHGGGKGFGKLPWRLGEHGRSHVTLTLRSADGDAGYPGNLDVSCTYSLEGAATLRVVMTATTDAPTIVNLAHHSYFNLDGSADVLDHELTLHSAFMTPVDDDLIPTGEIRSVAGTPFDFRAPRSIRNEAGQWYDHNFMVARPVDPETGLAHVATLRAPSNGLSMQLHSTEPAVQFYDGHKVAVPVEGLGGARYGANAGLCLEPQTCPDAPNRRHFPSPELRPGQVYRQVTDYRFG